MARLERIKEEMGYPDRIAQSQPPTVGRVH